MFALARLLTGIAALLYKMLRIATSPAARLLTSIATLLRRTPKTAEPSPPQTSGHWPPDVGDDVEQLSHHIDCWFPAVITARSPSGYPWPHLTVRIRGNAAGTATTDVLPLQIRPIQRLAAAQRQPTDAGCDAYDAYDRDNIRHLQECVGCPECDGLDKYYRECACKRRIHRHDSCIVCGWPNRPTGAQ